MKEKIEKIAKYGISADTLKIVALISMVIDHIAYYFYNYIPYVLYNIMKYGLGRIAMPIFVYLLIQGFFNTKNYNKYLSRIGMFGIITQVVIIIGYLLNKYIFDNYITNIYTIGNILLSFTLTLILLKVIHEPILIKKYDKKQNILFKIILVILLLNIYIFIPIDYGITVPLLAILFYAIERFKITVLISRGSVNTTIKGIIYKSVDDLTIKRIYMGLIFVAIFLCVIYGELYWTSLLAIIPLCLYNGERKKKSSKTKYMYYGFFPLHHILFYILAMITEKII